MNELRKRTHKDYDTFDLNIPTIYHPHNRQKTEAMIKRKARRKMKRETESLCGDDMIQHVGYDAAACGYEK